MTRFVTGCYQVHFQGACVSMDTTPSLCNILMHHHRVCRWHQSVSVWVVLPQMKWVWHEVQDGRHSFLPWRLQCFSSFQEIWNKTLAYRCSGWVSRLSGFSLIESAPSTSILLSKNKRGICAGTWGWRLDIRCSPPVLVWPTDNLCFIFDIFDDLMRATLFSFASAVSLKEYLFWDTQELTFFTRAELVVHCRPPN